MIKNMWAKIGDIYEVDLGERYAYFLVSHIHKEFGPLIRVFDAMFEHRPSSPGVILASPVRFSAFLPLNGCIKRKQVAKVASIQVPARYQPFPVFRVRIPLPESLAGNPRNWLFWDGKDEWFHGPLSSEEKQMPIRGVWGFELLCDRILSGWTAGKDT